VRVKYTLAACADCLAYIGSGDVTGDRPDLADEIREHLGSEADVCNLVSASGCDEAGKLICDSGDSDYDLVSESWFSRSPCECCGSPTAGERNRVAVLTE
jgi:hypothetical protein